MRHKNRNTIFPHLTYERTLGHLHRLEEYIEAYRLPPVLKRQVPVAVCTTIEQFCRTKKKFMYGDGEPMPQRLILNVPLVMDMLDWSDSWCVDNTRRHEEVFRKHVQDIANDDSFTISIKDLNTLINEACDIRQPMLVESLAAWSGPRSLEPIFATFYSHFLPPAYMLSLEFCQYCSANSEGAKYCIEE